MSDKPRYVVEGCVTQFKAYQLRPDTTGSMATDLCPQCNRPLEHNARFCGVCGSPALRKDDAPERFLGALISGKYLIQEIIGSGSMGVVYLAEQLSLGKRVALKILKRSRVMDRDAIKRFELEARAASSLNHPNSISVSDFGQCADGSPFIAMEFVDGNDLATVLSEEFPLDPVRVIRMMKQACSALDEAHAAGIIHRDLKLANIMLSQRRTGEEFVKVLDFGIAKIVDPLNHTNPLTREGLVCGTPAFMSPEQLRGLDIDARTDIYALGAMLFALLTGRLPFLESSAADMAARIITEDPPIPSKVRFDANVHPAFDAIVAKAMKRNVEERYASAKEMHDAIHHMSKKYMLSEDDEISTPEIHTVAPLLPDLTIPLRSPPSRPRQNLVLRAETQPESATTKPGWNVVSAKQPPVSMPVQSIVVETASMRKAKYVLSKAPEPPKTTHAEKKPKQAAPSALETVQDLPGRDLVLALPSGKQVLGAFAFFSVTVAVIMGVLAGGVLFMLSNKDSLLGSISTEKTHAQHVAYTKASNTLSRGLTISVVKARDAAQQKHAEQLLAGNHPVRKVPAVHAPEPSDKQPTAAAQPPLKRAIPPVLTRAVQVPKLNRRVPVRSTWTPKTAPNKVVAVKEEPKVEEKPPLSPYKLGVQNLAKNPDAALRHFQTATQQNPRNRAAWVHISKLTLRAGRVGKAKRACLRVISLGRGAEDAARISCEKMLKK